MPSSFCYCRPHEHTHAFQEDWQQHHNITRAAQTQFFLSLSVTFPFPSLKSFVPTSCSNMVTHQLCGKVSGILAATVSCLSDGSTLSVPHWSLFLCLCLCSAISSDFLSYLGSLTHCQEICKKQIEIYQALSVQIHLQEMLNFHRKAIFLLLLLSQFMTSAVSLLLHFFRNKKREHGERNVCCQCQESKVIFL